MFGLSKAQLLTGAVGVAGKLFDLKKSAGPRKPESLISHIWKFVEHESIHHPNNTEGIRKHGYGPAPDLVSASYRAKPHEAEQRRRHEVIDHIDVIKDFAWTESPKTSRHDVPTLFLREKKIQVNPQINQIANNLFVVAEKTARGASNFTPDEFKSKIANNQVKANNSMGEAMISGGSKLGKAFSELAGSKGIGVMAPYEHLYYTKDTGFVYSLPYMTGMSKNVQNSYGGTGTNSALLQAVGKVAEIGAFGSTGVNIADPGTYIDQPQLYSFGGSQKSYTAQFPLINTYSWSDVVRNWQLLFLLVYQNTPNRLTRDLIDPPCIYEANLDGTWYSKYAYINQLNINFIGATRKMTIDVPSQYVDNYAGNISDQFIQVETIIPDAYDVSITVTELVSETQNMMYHSINQANSKVSVQLAGQPVQDTTPGVVKTTLNKLTGD